MEAVARMQTEGRRTRAEWRERLFELIDRAGPMLDVEGPKCDAARRLSGPVLDFLREPDLLRLKLPQELGGAEADNALQFEIYERIAYHNAAASWCAIIYTDMIALATSTMTDAGIQALLDKGLPLICGGGGRLIGKVEPQAGGYRLNGKWTYGSGLEGSDWTAVMAMNPNDPTAAMMCLLPTAHVRSLDNWDAMGLNGTGSTEFVIEDVFVPADMAFAMGTLPVRGGPSFRLGVSGLIGHTVPAVAIAVARHALDDLVAVAREKQRGYMTRQTIGSRPAFQAFVGKADLQLKAARALMIENGLQLTALAEAGGNSLALEAEVRAAGTWVTELSAHIASDIFRWAGGEAVHAGSRFERALRDIHVASTHYCINNTSLESHGQYLLGMEGVAVEA